VFGN